MAKGALVVFEGPEGVGKTTQVRRLVAQLETIGVPCLHLREPGGTGVGESIRQVLLDPMHDVVPAAEALLFMASRAQLVDDRIRPALGNGAVVIIDRFFLSTYAYQIDGRGLPESDIRAANQLAVRGLTPDLTVVLDLPLAEGFVRADARGQRDRMELAGDEFHNRVSTAFQHFAKPEWQQSHPECGPIVLVDASGTEEEVGARVLRILASSLPGSFGPIPVSNSV